VFKIKIILFLISLVLIYPLVIEIDIGKSFSEKYSVYHIVDTKTMICKEKKDSHNVLLEYVCKLQTDVDVVNFQKKTYTFARIYFSKNDTNLFLHIVPLHKSLLYPSYQKIHSLTQANTDFRLPSKEWTILMFKDKNPIFKKQQEDNGLDFNIFFNRNDRPFIGALDIDRKPLVSDARNEVQALVMLRDYYKQKQFYKIFQIVQGLEKSFPNSAFTSEITLFKLRAYDGIPNEINSIQILRVGKQWLKDNPSDDGIPEVLYYMAKAQVKMSRSDLAENSLRSLIDRHPFHKFAQRAKIYLGDILDGEDNFNLSLNLYKEALYETKEIDVALLASKKIADKSLNDSIYKQAEEYYLKILNKEEGYILDDLDQAYELAIRLKLAGLYHVAGRVIEAITKKVNRDNYPDKHATYVFEAAQLFFDNDANKSMHYYELYLKLYPEGVNSKAAKRDLDELIFAKEVSKTPKEQLEYLDYIIKTYKSQQIAVIALYRKMKILFSQKKYPFILANEEKLKSMDIEIAPDKTKLLEDSVRLFAIESLVANYCEIASDTMEKYKIIIDSKYHKELYSCYMQQFRYESARELAQINVNMKSDDDLFWFYGLEQSIYHQQQYEETIKIGLEVLKLAKIREVTKYQDVLFDIYDSRLNLGLDEEVLKMENIMTSTFKTDIRNMKVYKSIIQIAQKRKDNFLLVDMAQKIFAIQDESKNYVESPWIDYAIIDAFKNLNKFEQALTITERMISLSKETRIDLSKLYYTISIIYQNVLNIEKQKKYLDKCIETNSSKTWSSICRNTQKWI